MAAFDLALPGCICTARRHRPTRAYLPKCLQDWFDRHGDELNGELKHIRNALDQVLASARFAATVQRDAQQVEFLAATHRLIRAKRHRPRATDAGQLLLFKNAQ